MRRSRRQREEENEMIQAIKYWQRSIVRGLAIVGLPLAVFFVLFGLFIDSPAGYEFFGWAEEDAKWDQIIKEKEHDMQKQLDEFTESTNDDVQNTIDDIRGTEDTTGTEQYSEEVQNTINELEQ